MPHFKQQYWPEWWQKRYAMSATYFRFLWIIIVFLLTRLLQSRHWVISLFYLFFHSRLMLSPEFRLRLKLGQKVKSFFFIWTLRLLSPNFGLCSCSVITRDQSVDWVTPSLELIWTHWLIHQACWSVNLLVIKFGWTKTTLLFSLTSKCKQKQIWW